MESPPGSDPSAGAADYPRWVMLDRGEQWQGASTADATTTTSASCYNSTGHTLQVSFRLAAPPAVSTLHVDARLPGKGADISGTYHALISAHRNSLLINLSTYPGQPDHFVYSAGAGGGARLLLLPPCGAGTRLAESTTVILRRGADELVGAILGLGDTCGRTEGPVEASLSVLRYGECECEWEHFAGIPVRHGPGQEAGLSWWETRSAVAVGDRFLCWTDQARGIIFSDVTAASPELWYVPLPADPLLDSAANSNRRGDESCRDDPEAYRNVCVTGAGAVRFVRVSPRCCCGGPGATACAISRRAFTVTAWTLRTDDMTTWEEDCVLDSGEPWAAAAAAATGVPIFPPVFPFVSVHDPDLVFFLTSEDAHRWHKSRDDAGDKTAWLVAVDMGRKTLRSVCRYRYTDDDDDRLLYVGRQAFLHSEFSSYFNTARPGGGGGDQVPASREEEEEMEVLAAIRETPGMAPDEMLRAHSVLAGDDRRVRFLAALPVGMRKEYCAIMTELQRNLRLANDTITASY